MPQHLLDFEPQLRQKPATTIEVERGPSMLPEAKRLNKQCQEILTRLQAGRASNNELARIALNYRARISDLRKVGIKVVCLDRDRETGLAFYEIKQ